MIRYLLGLLLLCLCTHAAKLGFIYPFAHLEAPSILNAAQVAVNEISEAGVSISLMTGDTGDDPDQALTTYNSIVSQVDGVIVFGSPAVIEKLSTNVENTNQTLLSISSDRCLVGDKGYTQTLFLVANDMYQASVFVELAALYQWNSVNIIYTDEIYGQTLSDQFKWSANDYGVTTQSTTISVDTNGQMSGLEKLNRTYLHNEGVAVIVCFLNGANPEDFLNQIQTLGYDSEGYIWMLSDTIVNNPNIQNHTALRGMIGVTPSAGRWKRDDHLYLQAPTIVSQLNSRLAYDAVHTYSDALEAVLASNASIQNASSVMSAFQQTDYIGASGYITYINKAERYSTAETFYSYYRSAVYYRVINFDPSSNPVKVGKWSSLRGLSFYNSRITFNVSGGVELDHIDPDVLTPPAFQWSQTPTYGANFDARFGGCSVVSLKNDLLYYIAGTNNPSTPVFRDIWRYDFRLETWTLLTVLSTDPGPRCYLGCTIDDTTDQIYIFGGTTKRGSGNDLWTFYINDAQWEQILPGLSPSPRLDMARWGVSDGFYIMSGQSAAPKDDLWFFSYEKHTWTRKTPPPMQGYSVRNGPMFATGWQTYNGTAQAILYTFGGGPNDKLYIYYTWNDTWDAYPITNIDDNGDDTFQSYSSDGVTWVLNDTLYTYFGWNDIQQEDVNGVYTLNLQCPGTNCARGQKIGNFETGMRDSLSGVMYGTDLLAIAGWGDALHNDLQVFSILDYSTIEANPDRTVPQAREGHAACIITNQMFVFGGRGYSLELGETITIFDDLWSFDLDKKTWQSIPPAGDSPSPRYGHTFTAVGFQGVIFGGSASSGMLDDVYIYSTISKTWRQSKTTSLPPIPRTEHISVSPNLTTILIYGGRDITGEVLTDLWRFDVVSEIWTNIALSRPPLGDCINTYQIIVSDVLQTTDSTCQSLAWNFTGGDCNLLKSYNKDIDWDNLQVGDSICIQQEIRTDGANCPANDYVSGMSAALVGDIIFFFGGWDRAYVLYPCVFSLNITSLTWNVKLNEFPGGERNHMGITNVGTSLLFLFGGSDYYDMFNDLWAYQSITDEWSENPIWQGDSSPKNSNNYSYLAQPLGPDVLGNPIVAYYSHHLLIFGGYGPEFGATGQGNLFQKQTWIYNLAPVCLEEVNSGPVILPGAKCVECSPGTVNSSCRSTPPGSYTSRGIGNIVTWSSTGCNGGFYNPSSGAASSSLCIPCSTGFYAPAPDGLQTGASVCLKCAPDEDCPISTAIPVPKGQNVSNSLGSVNSTQPQGIVPRTQESSEISRKLLIACTIVSIVVVIIGLITVPQIFASLDLVYAEKHATMENTPVFNRPTRWGGVCTIVFVLIALALVLSILVAYSIDNDYEIRSLVPDAGTPSAHWTATFVLIGGSKQFQTCIINQGQCAQLVTVDTQSTVTGMPPNPTHCYFNFSAENGAATCTLVWDCPNCSFAVGEAAISATFLQPGTFAQAIRWNFTSDSGYNPSQISAVYGTLYAESSLLIRSLSQPTTISIQATPVKYVIQATAEETEGYKVSYINSVLGTQVTPAQFPEQNGVAVSIKLTKTETSLQVDLRQKVTGLAILSQILGTVAGIIGAVAFLMTLFETGETHLRKLLGEQPSKDDKKLAIYQGAWLDLVEYQAKERPLVLKRQAQEAYEKGMKELAGRPEKDEHIAPTVPVKDDSIVIPGQPQLSPVEKAVGHFQDAARFGHPEGQYQLGLHLYKGLGCDRNIPEAIESWKKAADQNHVGASYELGMYYRKGGKKDYKKSLRYLRDAAEQDHADAMYWVAISLENEEGDKKYFPEARYWYTKAAKKGDRRAIEALKRPPFVSEKVDSAEYEGEEEIDFEEGEDEAVGDTPFITITTAPPSSSTSTSA